MGRALVRDPEAVPVRRAALQSRRQAARRHAHRDQEAASARRQDDGLCHARPDRGDDAGDAHRRHASGLAAAVRRAARRLQPPGEHVRRRLHGHPVDEFHPGAACRRTQRPARCRDRARWRRRGDACRCPTAPTRRPADGRVVLGVRPEHLFRFADGSQGAQARARRVRRAGRGRRADRRGDDRAC